MTQKTNRLHFSTRTVAMVLSIVMLIGSIATGSMLSTFAAYLKDAAKSDAVTQAATEGGDIALNAIPSEDAADDNAVENPALSDFEENEIVKNLKKDVFGDDEIKLTSKGDVDLSATGYSTADFYLQDQYGQALTDKKGISLGSSNEGTVEFDVSSYQGQFLRFYIKGGSEQYGIDNSTTTQHYISNGQKFNLGKNVNPGYYKVGNSADKVTFTFKITGNNDGNTISVSETTSSTTENTWTVAGDNTALFGTAWDTANTANNMTRQSNGTYVITYSNVMLKKGDIKFKVVKNHAWTTAYPASNKVVTVSEADYYNVTITYDPNNNNSVTASLEPAAKYTFTLGTTENATVTATYGKTTINERGHIDDIPVGVSVSVNITPDSGYKTKSVTSDDPNATITGTGDKRTVTMPAGNVTVTAAVEKYQAEMKRVYFYNKFTQYPMVIIYAYHKSGTTITDEIFGSGRTMTKMDNSDIWYIDLPEDAYIVFKGEGYSTGELEPLRDHADEPKYIPGSDRTDPGEGGYWGEYKDRSNVYSVTNGSTMSASNLFTSINATFYDYYVDGEISAGWLSGIRDNEYNMHEDWKWLPYGTLNQALSDYADADTENPTRGIPANSITYPLYFGNLNYADNASEVSNLYNFKKRANNSNGLNPASTAITGLTGQTLTGSNTDIHHYKSGATNENGAAMAIFDEDFLSGNNSQGKQLATILHSPSFPVRKEEYKTIYFDNATAKKTVTSGNTILAYIWKSTDTSQNMKVSGTATNNIYAFTIPEGYDRVIFYQASSTGTGPNDTNKYTGDLTIDFTKPQYNGTNWVAQTASAKTHTYYEYNSKGGKDNAFITDIDTSAKTAQINYYADSAQYAQSSSGNKGFFPFDYNHLVSASYAVDKVYLQTKDSWEHDGAVFYAYFFNDSGHSWQKMTKADGEKFYSCLIPTGYVGKGVIFARVDPASPKVDGWTDVWNQTKDLIVPDGTSAKVVFKIGDKDYDDKYKGTWKGGDVDVTRSATAVNANGYADSTNHYAHDQGFGVKLEIPFTINENGLNTDGTPQTFDFSGDDDLWVFIDNNLVLDLGGAHGATTGSINFNTMKSTAHTAAKMDTSSGPDRNGSFGGSGAAQWFDNTNSSKIHTMTIYYMERGMFDSNLKFGYSFHAIPNLLQVEKKVRTTSDDAHVKVNAGFFTNNNQAGAASNMSDLYIDNGERQVTLFEKAFQHDTFGITQNYPTTLPEGHSELQYTIGEALTTASKDADDNFTYTLHNNNDGDQIANFNGQINSGESITLSETINNNSNQFRYKPSLIVYDDARVVNGRSYQFTSGNGSDIGTLKDNEDGSYTFNFKPSVAVAAGAIEDLRLRARFQNQMKCHDLTLKKVVNSGSPVEDFTFEIKFKFDNSGSDAYIAYPLEINGSDTSIGADGRVTLKAGQSITMSGIPENAQVQIREITNNSSSYAYTSTTVTTETGDDVAGVAEVGTQDGVQFKMADENVDVEVKNATGEPVFISHSLHPESTGTGGTYVTVDVLDENDTVLQTYNKTNNVIKVDASYITYNSTDKLRIVLDSYPDHYNEFMDFYEQISDTMRELVDAGTNPTYTMTRSDETGVYQATITIAVKDLFNDKRAQLYTELPFYSKFGKQLVINHHLDVEHSDKGTDGDTFLRVEVLDASSTVVWSSPDNIETNYTQNGDIVVPAKYFWNDADNSNKYKLKVWLRTDLKGFSQFKNFTILGKTFNEELSDHGATVTLTPQTENRQQFGTITFAMTRLFDGSTPLVSELPYLSQLYIPDYKYNFKYTYPAYVKSYGYQSFTVDEPFTSDELQNNMKLNNGLLVFQDTEKERNFINAHTPYEDNFQKDVSIVEYTSSHSDQGYTISYDITMKNTDEQLTVDFNFPYATNTAAGDSYAYIAKNGVVEKLSDGAVNTVRRTDVYGRSWISYNDCRFPHLVTETNKPQFIKAPLIIHDTQSDKDLYFKFWRVETIKNYNTEVREYTRCYDYEFNLSIFQDCTVTPIYGEEDFGSRGMPNPPTTYNMYNRFDPDVNRAHYRDNTVSITFIENSRNQHNNCDYGEICEVDENTGKITKKTGTKGNTPTSRQGAADRVYSDFLLTFDNVINGDSTVVLRDRYKNQPNVMKAGLIIQAVGDIETEDGKLVPKTDTYYSNNQNYAGYSTEAIKKYLQGDSSSGVSGVGKTEFDVTELDNKNRAQVYYGINAAKPHTQEAENANPLAPLDTSVNKTKVYKAFAYIGNVDGDKLSNVIVSPKPVYFTIYIDASINPGESLPEGYFTLSANNNNGN